MIHWIMLAAIASVGLSGCGTDSGEVAANAPGTTDQIESSTDSIAAEEQMGSPQLYELQYPLAEFEYPSYEVSGVVTNTKGN